jgi:hypothetical protein
MIKAVCLSGKRTGSTFVYKCLDSHPYIEAYGEMFYMNKPLSNREYLRLYHGGVGRNITFKAMYNQVEHFRLLSHLDNIKIINIVREPYKKVLSDLVSNYLSAETIKERENVGNIKPNEFMRFVNIYKQKVEGYRNRLKDGEYIEVNMKDLIGRKTKKKTYMKAAVAKQLCEFVGVGHYKLWSDSERLTEYFKNRGKSVKHDYWSYFKYAKEIKNAIKD